VRRWPKRTRSQEIARASVHSSFSLVFISVFFFVFSVNGFCGLSMWFRLAGVPSNVSSLPFSVSYNTQYKNPHTKHNGKRNRMWWWCGVDTGPGPGYAMNG